MDINHEKAAATADQPVAESSSAPHRVATPPAKTTPPRRSSATRVNNSNEATSLSSQPSAPAPAVPLSATASSCTSASVASAAQVQQVGQRQGMRSRSRTTRKASNASSTNPPLNLPRYNSEDHPLSAHKLAAKGYHSFSCLGVPFHVPKRYTFLRELGIGAYGCVALARDEELDTNVAIKKVTRVFERDVLARRALREVAVLRHMLKNQNCTALIDFDTTFIDFSEIYLVLSASEADLSQIIRSGQALSDAHLQYFAAQLLRGVRHMHAANIIHRDLKPGNLLVNADCALFICDFGLARAFAGPATEEEESTKAGDAPQVDGPSSSSATSIPPKTLPPIRTSRLDFPGGPLTEYVSTRWYRAPEIMLGFREGYGTEIDMWSVGCILAELASGKPLFDGKDYVDQIARIHSVLGPPSQAVIDRISSERARVYVESLPKQAPVPLSKILKRASPGLLDLLDKLLAWDPRERLSAADALKHPWLSAYHGIIEQWERPEPFSKFAEVELINSLQEFKGALQKEADEVKGEYEALFGESEEDGDESTADSAATADGDADGEEEGEGPDNDVGSSRRHSFDDSTVGSRAFATNASQDYQSAKTTPSKSNGSNAGGGMDSLRPGLPSEASSGSSSGGSSSDLSRVKRNSHGLGALSSPDPYSTDTGTAPSPITPSGESALGEHVGGRSFPSGPTKSSIAMTPAGGTPNQETPSSVAADDTVAASSAPPATTQAVRGPRQTLNSISVGGGPDDPAAQQPRYRRRAISNAPRPQEGEERQASKDRVGMPPRTPSAENAPTRSSSLRLLPDSARHKPRGSVDSTTSSAVQHLDLEGVASQFPPDRDDVVLTPQKPSPDFRRYTTDLIPRPRFEQGAFGSPALDAGDDFAKQLRRRSSGASSKSGTGHHTDLAALRMEAGTKGEAVLSSSAAEVRTPGGSRSSSSRASSGSTLLGGLDGKENPASDGQATAHQSSDKQGSTTAAPSSLLGAPSSVINAATSALSHLVPGVGAGGGGGDKGKDEGKK